MGQRRLPDKVITNLEFIAAESRDGVRAWKRALECVREPEALRALAEVRNALAEIESLAREARGYKYE